MRMMGYLTLCLLFLLGILNGVIGKVVFSLDLHFDSGVKYEYDYSTSISVTPISMELKEDTDITLQAVVYIHSLWRNHDNQQEQLLHVKIQDLKLASNSNNTITKHWVVSEHIKEPFLVHIHSGKIQGVFDVSSDNTVSLNFKKGLASLLQIQTSSGVMLEDDTTGQCQVSYHTEEDDIFKVKDYQTCQNMTGGLMASKQIFGVISDGISERVYTMDDDQIKSVKSKEFRSLLLKEQPTVGLHISSRQFLQLLSTHSGHDDEIQGELQEVFTSLKTSYVNHTIRAIPEVKEPVFDGYPVSKLLDRLKANGMQISPTTTNVFLQLSESLQNLNKTEIRNILRSNAKFVPILIDALAAASTPASLDAFMSAIDITNPKTSQLLEKFLYACEFSSQPSPHLISIISHIVSHTSAQWEKHEMALIVLGTVMRKMCSADMCHVQEVQDAMKLILSGLKSSKDEKKIKSYLLAIKSARLPETLPVLLLYIDRSKSLLRVILSALQDLPSGHITEEVKQHIRAVFTQEKKLFPAALRLDAAQLLLMHNPQHKDVRQIILKIAEEKPEVSKFLTNKIVSILQSGHPARKVILDVLKDSQLNNYFHLARVGYSSSCAGLMTENKDMITTYDFNFLFSEAGMLKQSDSHIYAHTRGGNLHLLKVSLEASGLDSLFGSGPTEAGEEEELMAGMSAMFLGVDIQPIIFFQGYSDLMSRYFSAEEGPMKILSGNILVLKHKQSLILQNGLQAQGFFHGGLSVDMSADVAFSLFSQESKTSVNNKFSLVVSASAEVNTPLISTTVKTVVEMNSSMSVITTVKFSEMPVQYCLQLIREPLHSRERMTVQVTNQKRRKTVQRKKHKWILPGEETALHKDNSKMCRNLLNEN
ncbi:microsomal triglyceride transfer protein large subunit-like [Trichomycterus rosablanca]|uniref:microsomal triglyceride transfer protein large subunit-like n=1 Tax=Trichomycterus rosablanca TaxID=2290929 RepID=UPI002F35B5D2